MRLLVAVCLVGAATGVAVARVEGAPRLIWRLVEPARGIPARDGQSVYFLSHEHELIAASVTSGRVRWRIPMDSTGFTFGSRVVVRGDVVVAGDYDLMGVHRRTGRRLWTFTPGDDGGAGMHLGDATRQVAFTGSLAGSLHAVVVSTGRPAWSLEVGDPAETTVYSPVVYNDLVAATFSSFGGAATGGLAVVEIASGKMRWRRQVPGSTGASGNPVFAGKAVVAASRDGTIHAFSTSTGSHLWTWPKVERLGDEQDYRPLVVEGRTVIAGSLSGEIVAHDLLTRRILWRRTPALASVAFNISAHNGVVYVPYFSNEIVALRVSDGAELWRIGGNGAEFRWVPLVEGPLLFASGSRELSLFRHTGPYQRGRR